MLTRFYSPISWQARQISTKKKVKLSVQMNDETYRLIENEELKPRKHPGRISTRLAVVPKWLTTAVQRVLEDMPTGGILADSQKLVRFLSGRHVPAEKSAVQAKYVEIRNKIEAETNAKMGNEDANTYESTSVPSKDDATCLKILKQCVHAWSPVNYNRYAGLLHLVARSPPEYAVLHRIFQEISDRDRDFRPKTLLDFGSGLGSVTWATSHFWPKAIAEHMCVDVSTEMHDLAESIIEDSHPKVNKIFYRQYIPMSNRAYDLVVSAYTLMELPSMQTRLENLAKLWARTERYLIIVEQGNNAGFKLINEARNFILHMQRAQTETDSRRYIFAPCSHEFACPRYKTDDTPCNFEISYSPFRLQNSSKPKTERFSYIVFKKDDSDDKSKNWPRIVRPTIVRSKHTICRLCTADGRLSEIIFTATKHGKWMYRCARSSRWGDRLPAETSIDDTPEEHEVKTQQGEATSEDVGDNAEEGTIDNEERIDEDGAIYKEEKDPDKTK